MSKQIAASLLKDEKPNTLDSSELFSDQEKEEILDRLTNESEIASRLHSKAKINSKEDWKILQSKIDAPRKTYYWRYAAAAAVVIGMFTAVYVLKDDFLNDDVAKPIIVNNQIVPGDNKAILTLETGEEVNLVKDVKYTAENLQTNGEEIVYKESSDPELTKEEIAYNFLTIPRGGQFQITLSDGTHVWLNSESKLKYPVRFIEGGTREVELLYGEAYFDVSPSTEHKGARFKVINKSQSVEVLGTEFNIKAYKDEVTVYTTLVEGKVKVRSQELAQDLVPNQQSKLNTTTNVIDVHQVDVYNEIAWKDGVFSFEDKSLKDIMTVLSRWYDIDVVFEKKSLESERFVGVLKKNYSIETILSIFQEANIINGFEIDTKSVIIK
ncbi:FecR domain-containing protein [Maribacter sp. MMG018]|uniref:FecR family protein n=1 Tax=Maribacter sp. MMG018 TaxID=2822688 RepID=UPI001B359999|nr:FecR domain-containing protein [Maribacter sp. MMG018]MBQ4915098.1 FecR domain-containing protein [Maribacter sp. MMG018]